jgi:hypothetical protein
MASPAGPNLTSKQYKIVAEVLRLNPTAENAPIRQEIAAFLAAQKRWQQDAQARRTNTPW